MKADRETLRELLRLYLLEYGSEGYDSHTFVDWVACSVAPGIGTDSLIAFYQGRIAALRALWAGASVTPPPSGGCRQVVVDNYGELVELWDCPEGEERFSLSPEGRARVYRQPSLFRAERWIWTAAGRGVILDLREQSRKAARKDAGQKSARRRPSEACGAPLEVEGSEAAQAPSDESGSAGLPSDAPERDGSGESVA